MGKFFNRVELRAGELTHDGWGNHSDGAAMTAAAARAAREGVGTPRVCRREPFSSSMPWACALLQRMGLFQAKRGPRGPFERCVALRVAGLGPERRPNPHQRAVAWLGDNGPGALFVRHATTCVRRGVACVWGPSLVDRVESACQLPCLR